MYTDCNQYILFFIKENNDNYSLIFTVEISVKNANLNSEKQNMIM